MRMLIGAIAALVISSSAQATSLTAFDQGWYDEAGQHYANNLNSYTVAGFYRSFYAFDLSTTTAAASAISITFTANNGYTRGGTLGFFDYIASVSSLLDGTGGAAAYRDIGDGWMFGQAALAQGMMPEFTVQLSDGFVSQFNAARLSDDKRVALGASAFHGEFWSGSGAVAAATLNVTEAPSPPPPPPPAELPQPSLPDFDSGVEVDLSPTPASVPEPAMLTLFGLGFVGVAMSRRRRR